ncbi:MAG TPA: carboxylesterase family protein [Opitutus sp.]|nr:carboxylesterase family protein [Opitutus sp.]
MTRFLPLTARLAGVLTLMTGLHAQQLRHVQQRIADGVIEGVVSADGKVRTFKGIPYAAPPVGPLRWQPPQPVQPWTGVRPAIDYGPRAMQGRIFDDMVFHDTGPSEDCLYLNVWLPEDQPHEKLPVMVWIHGGGFVAGASSEPRQDGGNLCKRGVIVVSMNYRMGIFGFMAHPELTAESAHHASGNYGLMDIVASLQWVHDNIAAFGGDPGNVTIFGESAGSWAVSALMAAPPARGLFQRAIGESGGFVGGPSRAQPTRADAEQSTLDYTQKAFGTSSLADLRALPAQKLLDATLEQPRPHFSAIVDGYVLPADGRSIFGTGQQAHVPLLAGWNRDEGNYRALFGDDAPTLMNYVLHAVQHFGDRAQGFLKAYSATTDAEAKRAAADWSGDNFIAYSTWKWIDLCRATGGQPVYRYHFEQTLPLAADAPSGAEPIAPHASDIEFVFEMLPTRHEAWRPDDFKVSAMMAAYWTNFAKTGNPNGPGLPEWPRYDAGDGYQVMHLNAHAAAAPDQHRDRYEFLDR